VEATISLKNKGHIFVEIAAASILLYNVSAKDIIDKNTESSVLEQTTNYSLMPQDVSYISSIKTDLNNSISSIQNVIKL
jgi:hypothetical protein